MDLELRHLNAFVAVCDEGSYTRAAAGLHVTQPSLTRTIQQLEQILECDLIRRTSRRLEVTDSGEQFLRHSRRILNDVATVRSEMRSNTRVRVGFAWLLPGAWFTEAFARYEQADGQITLHRMDDPAAALADGDIDVAVVRNDNRRSPSTTWRPIAEENRVVAVSAHSDLAHAQHLHWKDLANHPLVVNTITGTTTAASWNESDPNRTIVTCNNFDEWIELVAADRGIGAVPAIAVERSPHPGVVYLDIPGVPRSNVYLGWRSSPAPLHSTRRFLDVAFQSADIAQN
ncbi:LysR family transcriptional regulator [Rhodococcus sp. NPDC058521]|uniref:LysR family transcriptional regulator n=1 Tax=Rhodococcus sp. NPDC058521 TaxID=3346536 RepID=UPI003658B6A9